MRDISLPACLPLMKVKTSYLEENLWCHCQCTFTLKMQTDRTCSTQIERIMRDTWFLWIGMHSLLMLAMKCLHADNKKRSVWKANLLESCMSESYSKILTFVSLLKCYINVDFPKEVLMRELKWLSKLILKSWRKVICSPLLHPPNYLQFHTHTPCAFQLFHFYCFKREAFNDKMAIVVTFKHTNKFECVESLNGHLINWQCNGSKAN